MLRASARYIATLAVGIMIGHGVSSAFAGHPRDEARKADATEPTIRVAAATETTVAATEVATTETGEVEFVDGKPVFTETYLSNTENIELGRELWFEQCTHCHGFKAYPGKAPKLKPHKYTPEFVYKRVAKGFKKMPAWEEVYEVEELLAIVSYVKSKGFSP